MEQERGFKMTEKEQKDMKEAEDKRLAYLRELEDAARIAEEKEREAAAQKLRANGDAVWLLRKRGNKLNEYKELKKKSKSQER